MTKKDYNLVVTAVNNSYNYWTNIGSGMHDIRRAVLDDVVDNLASALSKNNKVFNVPKFRDACRATEPKMRIR